MPTAPASMDEFNQQAQSFVTKAKAQGLDNTTIANTLTFMYKMTQDNLSQQNAQRGSWAYNSDTGEYYNTATADTKKGAYDSSISSDDFGAPNMSSNADSEGDNILSGIKGVSTTSPAAGPANYSAAPANVSTKPPLRTVADTWSDTSSMPNANMVPNWTEQYRTNPISMLLPNLQKAVSGK